MVTPEPAALLEVMVMASLPPSVYCAAPSGAPVPLVMRTVTCRKSASPGAMPPPSPSMSRSRTTKPGTADGALPPVRYSGVFGLVPGVSPAVGASLTATMVSAIVMSGGLFDTLPPPVSPPICEPVSSKDTVSVTSPASAPLRSWLTWVALR
ncbi:hypothetical protein D9M72_178050 [compost metagenome]